MDHTQGTQSETPRRLVVAAIMALLLTGATAVAAWMAGGAQARRHPDLAADALDTFTFQRPADWRRAEVSPDAADAQAGLDAGTLVFDEDGGFARRIVVAQMISAQSTSREPAHLVRLAMRKLGPVGSFREVSSQSLRHGPVLAAVTQARYYDEQRQLRHRIFAVATVDGRRHLILDLSGTQYAAAQNVDLMQRLMPTIADTRYTVIDGLATIDGVVVAPDPRLLALRKAADAEGEKIVFVPATEPRFVLLQAMSLDTAEPFDLTNARIAGAADEIVSVPIDMLAALDPAVQTTPLSRLSAAMVWRFWRATGVVPSAQLVNRLRVSPARLMYEMTLNVVRPLSTFRALYGVPIDDARSVLIEAVAEYDGQLLARQSALLVAQHMRSADSTDDPTPPSDAAESPAPRSPPPAAPDSPGEAPADPPEPAP